MVLKHRDTEVLRFDWFEPEGVRVTSVNESALRFLPIEMHGEPTDERHPNYNLSASRLRALEEFIQNRASKIVEFGVEADRFLLKGGKNGGEPLTDSGGHGVMSLQRQILQNIEADPYVSQEELSQILGVSLRMVQRQTAELKTQGRLQRIGTGRVKSWKVIH